MEFLTILEFGDFFFQNDVLVQNRSEIIKKPGRNWEPESPSLQKKLRVAGGGWRVAGGEWRVAGGEWRVAGGEWRVSQKMVPSLPCPSKLMSKIFLENLQNFYKIPCFFKQCIFFFN